MRNINTPSKAERVVTGALIGTGIGIAAEIALKSFIGLHNPLVNPIEDYLYLPTRFALLGSAFGLGRADFDKNGRTTNLLTPFLVAGAIGITLDVGETIADKLVYPNYPLTGDSLFLAANTGALIGASTGYNYLYGRRSIFR